jgi:signal transduction histidine kinase
VKLLSKSTLYFFLFSILAFIAGGIIFYSSIRSIIYKQIDASLNTEKEIIRDQVEHTDSIPDFSASFGHMIAVRIYQYPLPNREKISDTIFNAGKYENEIPCRHLYFTHATLKGKGFSIDIFNPVSEKQELLDDITFAMCFLFFTLLVVSIVVNYWVSKKIWLPFYGSLRKISRFELDSADPLVLEKTNIIEFKRLNRELERMADKVRKDYLNLKEFNENAAHEIQTPLAVIRSKLELLMQNEDMNQDQIQTLQSISDAASRLSKLNKGLLLISKIDNNQYESTGVISFNEIIGKHLANFEEVLVLKKIAIEKAYPGAFTCTMNPLLAEILVSNLISNAVRHTSEGGFIRCCIENDSFLISNPGPPLNMDPSLLFERFKKLSHNSDSVGLGLSIVRKIVNSCGLQIQYTVEAGIHTVCIKKVSA